MKFGKSILHLNTVDSTNKYLLRFAKKGNILDGTIVFADKQLQGVGQEEKKWFSEPKKSFTCSIYLQHQNFDPILLPLLNMHFSLCFATWLEEVGQVKVSLKWPNDLIVNNKKIGGILIQNSFKGQQIRYSILGLGINVNNDMFPNQIKTKATSLFMETQREVPISCVLKKMTKTLNRTYTEQYNSPLIEEYYNERLYNRGVRQVFFDKINKRSFCGLILCVNKRGNVIIEMEDGKRKEWKNGELKQTLST